MATEADFDFSAKVIMAGGAAARANWEKVKQHTVAEWSGDLDATMATMTKNGTFQVMHATGLDIRGWDNVKEFYRRRFQTFSGQGFFAHRWVVSDEAIVGQGYFDGRPNGVFFGTPTSGKHIILPMAIWIYFADGLVQGEAAYCDGAELARQIREGAPAGLTVKTPLY